MEWLIFGILRYWFVNYATNKRRKRFRQVTSLLPWVPEVFFSRATGSFALSAAGRHVFSRRPN